jgi:porphobilinogen synthase
LSSDLVVKECQEAYQLGILAVALFPSLPDSLKDRVASESTNPDGLLQRTICQIKSEVPKITIITDVAMDPYSIDGHDGLVQDGEILNDATLEILVRMAVSQAEAGVDIVAPSDMMDGRVGAIRKGLDQHGHTRVGILAYSAKYASAFYGPFRDALNSEPRSGDKKTYQMDPANRREAVREILMDVDQGADMVMVKPAIIYLDVIAEIKARVNLPVVAYNVSGEYAMIKAANKLGWLDGEAAMVEMLTAIKRSGADIILTYFAKEMAELC